ncbi:TPA: hypothetical protein JD264_24070 [Serratia fonticola]|nr:hypothetical protein [Serratia fonticola]
MFIDCYREQLYRLVWQKTINEIAFIYRLPLGRVIYKCIELQIPRPLEGYWRAVAKGTAPPVPSLPPFKDKDSILHPKEPAVTLVNAPEIEQPLSSVPKSVPNGRSKSPTLSISGAQLFSATKEILLKSQVTQLGY